MVFKRKIGIISTLIREKKFEGAILGLKDEIERAGFECKLLRYGDFYLSLKDDVEKLFYRNSPFNPGTFSLFIFKLGFSKPGLGDLYLPEIFGKFKIPYFNSIRGYLLAKSKFISRCILHEKGISVPHTFLVRQIEDISNIDIKFPIIIKPDVGSKGKDIYFCMDLKCVVEIFKRLWEKDRNQILLVEKFYESRGDCHEDLRIFVLGDEIIGSMKRVARKGDFRCNYSLGGNIYPVKISDELRNIAITSARALGLYMAGVDILETKNGPIVLEVNGNPGIDGISKVNPHFFEKFVKKIKADFNL